MKKKILIVGLLAVAVAAIVIASLKRGGDKGLPVTIAAVKAGSITGRVSGPGKVDPEAIVNISAHIPGKITRLAVREGEPVQKGQLLLELDRTQYEARVQQSRGFVEAQRAQVELAKAQHEKAQLDLKRVDDLHQRNLASEQELDLARTTARVEEARLQAAEQALEQAVGADRAARDDLDKCRYTAPMDGVVTQLNVEEGEIAVTGTMNNPGTVLMAVADLARMEVEAEIDETDVVDVKLGQKTKIKVDAFPDTSFAGTVTEIANTAVTRNRGTQEEVTNFTVKTVFDARIPELRPGMSATVEIETARREGVLKAPIQAIVTRSVDKERKAEERNKAPRKSKAAKLDTASAAESTNTAEEETEKRVDGVYVLREGRAAFVPVKTGISDEHSVEIESGLGAGDKLITGPYQTLRSMESGKKVVEKKETKPEKEGRR